MRRRAPRGLGPALAELTSALAPATTLARVQAVWRDAMGDALSAEAQPLSERGGTLVVGCSSSVWAQELEFMGAELRDRLNGALGAADGAAPIRELRFRVGSPTRS